MLSGSAADACMQVREGRATCNVSISSVIIGPSLGGRFGGNMIIVRMMGLDGASTTPVATQRSKV